MNEEPKPPAPKAFGVGQGMDYGEQADVHQVHAAVQREKREPRVGAEPLSIWLIAVYGLAVFFGGAYLGRYSGNFSGEALDPYGGEPHAMKKLPAHRAQNKQWNFRRTIAAKRFSQPIAKPVTRPTDSACRVNILRLLVQSLRLAARVARP